MYIAQTHSTNTYLKEHYLDSLAHGYSVRAGYQTAGRGQAGNGWESEEGQNLLISTLLRLGWEAQEQFRINQLVSLAVCRTVQHYLSGEAVCIKWPNDIYVGDKKVAGILIEHSLVGNQVEWSIAGVGLNVNQSVFRSSAPNPISMHQLSGQTYDLDQVEQYYIEQLQQAEALSREELEEAYGQNLYRKEGWHWYVEREVDASPTTIAQEKTDKAFRAEIAGVTREGQLQLRRENGDISMYHFKQIRFVI